MFGVGEHHREDFAVSATAVVLGAAASRTERIRLTSAVSVLSSDDPVRVFQSFATLDLLSGGRADHGRARLVHRVVPAVRLRPRRLRRQPERFAPLAGLHREAASRAGHEPQALSINFHGLIADDSGAAADAAFESHRVFMDRIGRERGWPPMTRDGFEASRTLRGANVVGDPGEVIEILVQHEVFGHQRTLLQFSVGPTVPRDGDALDRAVRDAGGAGGAGRGGGAGGWRASSVGRMAH